jgi:hypothetical protein
MPSATEIKRNARVAGVLYLAMSILAMLDYFYLKRLFVVSGDPAATARNILAQEPLYRISILTSLATQVLFILVVLALYRLFKDVDRNQARTMVALVGTGIVAQFAGFVLDAVPLVLLSGAHYLSAFSRQQLETLSYAALSLGGKQGELLTAIWGLWLFPFAVLTIKSGFLPKFLGALLVITGIAYVGSSIAAVAFPEHVNAVRKLALPLYFGEFIVVLWLAIIGAKPRTAEA